ncbi:MAG: 23S rRNA (pseudouridine(1915)-N(3))-methyltransferase RlmH [Clostridiales Family XIII bacterium]|jgi:23S rRNA (pseudouridine1915-N3)-methyltransferase|nr:23S rRNA (pseudouridine(1915)-N(3))-methyltransferase RlmH [Clostridiales Family XIII bacterium]
MNIDIVCVGNLKEKYWRDAEAEYLKRLSAYGKMNIIQIKETLLPANASPANEREVVASESKALADIADKRGFVVALAGEGKPFSSEAFAAKLRTLAVNGVSRAVFLIGGSLGLSKEVIARCDLTLSLSQMTFPHQMARIILLEQLYRSFKISNNETYHK